MRVSKKVKIITLLSIITAAFVSLACASINNNTNELSSNQVTKQSISKWKAKAPELFSNVRFSGLMESSGINNNLSESMAQLQGVITNPFGIRDDILEYILKYTSTNDNSKLFAIQMAVYDKQMMFTNESDINKLANKSYASFICLSKNLTIKQSLEFVRGYEKILRSTRYSNDLWENVENKLNHHVISADFGIQNQNLEQRCQYLLSDIQ